MTKLQRIAAAIAEALEVRRGDVLDQQCINDRSRNGAFYVLAALEEGEQENTPTGYEVHETAEEHAERVIK